MQRTFLLPLMVSNANVKSELKRHRHCNNATPNNREGARKHNSNDTRLFL